MRIAINTRFLLSHKMEGFGWFTYEVAKRLAENHPEHTFILFFDRPFDKKFVFADNVIPVVLNPPARHPILFYIWFEFSVFNALKKHKADVFFSPDGYLSLRSKVPQIGVIHDLNFEQHPQDVPWVPRTYLKYFFPKFAQKATKIITVSEYSKQDIIKRYQINPEKITVAWNGVSPFFQPINEIQKELIRKDFSNGNPYFIFVGALHPRKNIKRLLEAFEQFSKIGGKENLIIVGENLWNKDNSYLEGISENTIAKIHFTGHLPLEKLTQVMAAANCLTYVPYFEGFGIPLVEAMQSGVPVIAGNLTSLPEVCGEAALYVNPMEVNEIAVAMRVMSENSDLRVSLIEKGIERSKLFTWDKTAEVIWKEIESLF
jgi:glycosyltransferase involved in cell wall biosynthesis